MQLFGICVLVFTFNLLGTLVFWSIALWDALAPRILAWRDLLDWATWHLKPDAIVSASCRQMRKTLLRMFLGPTIRQQMLRQIWLWIVALFIIFCQMGLKASYKNWRPDAIALGLYFHLTGRRAAIQDHLLQEFVLGGVALWTAFFLNLDLCCRGAFNWELGRTIMLKPWH